MTGRSGEDSRLDLNSFGKEYLNRSFNPGGYHSLRDFFADFCEKKHFFYTFFSQKTFNLLEEKRVQRNGNLQKERNA